VLLALSGRVDSFHSGRSCCNKAIGDSSTCLCSSTRGSYAQGGPEFITEFFDHQFQLFAFELHHAAIAFLDQAYDGISASRRQAQEFHRRWIHPGVRGGKGKRLGPFDFFLGPGARFYPDVIEIVVERAWTPTPVNGWAVWRFKSHHNVGGLPKDSGSSSGWAAAPLFKGLRVRRWGRSLRPGPRRFVRRNILPWPRLAAFRILVRWALRNSTSCGTRSDRAWRKCRRPGGYIRDLAGVRRAAAGAQRWGRMGEQFRTYCAIRIDAGVFAVSKRKTALTADWSRLPLTADLLGADLRSGIVNRSQGRERVGARTSPANRRTIEWGMRNMQHKSESYNNCVRTRKDWDNNRATKSDLKVKTKVEKKTG